MSGRRSHGRRTLRCSCKGTPIVLADGTMVFIKPRREGHFIEGGATIEDVCQECGGVSRRPTPQTVRQALDDASFLMGNENQSSKKCPN